MEKNQFKILFMDDEIFANDDNPSILAANRLEQAGFSVTRTDKMSVVLDNYYKEYHHIYILDVDMARVADIIDGNGTSVGQKLRQLSILSQVIIYSARGGIDDWFAAANFHFQAYFHKLEDKVEKLISFIEALFTDSQRPSKPYTYFTEKDYDPITVLYYRENKGISIEQSKSLIQQIEPDSKIISVSNLDEIIPLMNQHCLRMIVILHKMFTNREATYSNLTEILKQQPKPNCVIGLFADNDGDRDTIIRLINLHPFRLVNLSSTNSLQNLEAAVQDALHWYGESEIFELPEPDSIIRYPITAEELNNIIDDRSFTIDYPDEFKEENE